MYNSSAPRASYPDGQVRRTEMRTVGSAAAASNPRLATRPIDPVDVRWLVGLADLPTIVAVGPFGNRADALRLAAAVISVRQHCSTQLVLLGEGAQHTAEIVRGAEQDLGSCVHVVPDSDGDRWSDVVAAGDVVALGGSCEPGTLLDVMAVGRPVVAPTNRATVELVLPAIAGLLYPPGDVPAMANAMLRLLSAPVLCRGMGGRAANLARRHRLESLT
jgi:glycosyltransferase involved in cell wall biosynthesis